jgi:chemotaxis signal transduction protein
MMLLVVFRLGAEDCGIDGRSVVEVLPLVPLRDVPGAPTWLLGRLEYRSSTVPVIDLCALAGLGAAPRRMSTRLLVVHHGGREDRLLALAAPEVLDTVSLPGPPADAPSSGADAVGPPGGGIRLVTPESLVPPALAEQAFAVEAPA